MSCSVALAASTETCLYVGCMSIWINGILAPTTHQNNPNDEKLHAAHFLKHQTLDNYHDYDCTIICCGDAKIKVMKIWVIEMKIIDLIQLWWALHAAKLFKSYFEVGIILG